MRYEYECKECKKTKILYRMVKNRNDPVACEDCGKFMTRKLGTTLVNNNETGGIPGICKTLPGGPVYVKSKKHFKELCKKHDLYPAGL